MSNRNVLSGWQVGLNILSFVPCDDIRDANLPKSGEERESCEEDRCYNGLDVVKCRGSFLNLISF